MQQSGLRARYCANELVVYMDAAEVKGIGGDHRAIQQARRSFFPERERGVKLPMLSWLDAGDVVDANGTPHSLPPCIRADYSEPLPTGRAALAGEVVDPWTVVREREAIEKRERPCEVGRHGIFREQRTVKQEVRNINVRNQPVEVPVGTPTFGPWKEAPNSRCRDDFTFFEAFSRPCSWYQGEPFNRAHARN